jgi:competence CoiA-like predicted nuclease
MLYALINNIKTKASETGLRGICPLCDSEVYSKCGEQRIWHWAHKKKDCDTWHEPETECHKEWKTHFPIENVEVVINKEGRIHRADILTSSGVCIEIQNSPISAKVVGEREDFYRKIIWVVNAERFKNGLAYLLEKEMSLCHDFLPEFTGDYKPIGFKPFPTFLYKNTDHPIISEIITKFDFIKETYTGAYYHSLLGLTDLEIFEKRKQIIEFLREKAMINPETLAIEEIYMTWNNIPRAWDEALAPILLDIGNDKLIYINGSDKVCNGIALVTKKEFLKNPDLFTTENVEECYGDDSWL